jgi:stress response protein YsnF
MKPTEQQQQNLKIKKTRTDDIAIPGKERVAVPVIKEDMQVGKREVEKGGVRVETRMVESPVEETVNLREENVRVERVSTNRPLSEAELAEMQNKTIEVIEHAEVPVIAKEARVVEEVVVTKSATQHSETFRDTVKHTEVFVQDLQDKQTGAWPHLTQFSGYDSDFRSHFAQSSYIGYKYDDMLPAYQYGYDIGMSDRYRGKDWDTIDRDAGLEWERRNPGTWAKVKSAVKHSWLKATGKY